MERSHTEDYLKKQAKKIRRVLKVPHHEALDRAVRAVGFQNWKHYKNCEAEKEKSEELLVFRKPWENG